MLQPVEIGTPQFQAPEIMKAVRQQKAELEYNAFKADVYSLGLCVLNMATLQGFTQSQRAYFFEHKDEFQKRVKTLRKEVKTRYGVMLSKLIKVMLEPDPFQRPDFRGLYAKIQECRFVPGLQL